MPKAQNGSTIPPLGLTPEQQSVWEANQDMFGYYVNDSEKSAPQGMVTPGLPTGTPLEMAPASIPNYSNPFAPYRSKLLETPITSVTPLLGDVDEFNEPYGPLKESDYYANVAQQNIAAPFGTTFDENNAYAPKSKKNKTDIDTRALQFLGQVPFIASGVFANMGKKREQREAEDQFRNRFLSDSLYTTIPEGYSGNRGDYTLNYGTGLNFRPDEAVYGQFGKVAQYGGEMKRKIKITGLPSAAYGGTQNASAIDEMYPYNSNVRRAEYSNMLEGPGEGSVQQYAEEVPREIANIEAERGETIVKPSDDGLLNMYKIGGKRHSEGGTPLQAGPGDFIFSDTKDMKIKDPAILESFGMTYKKGGYTPAKISKKFNLNDPNIQKTLNDPKADLIARTTAERMFDNNLSQLGKLALVQEARKGFPQGAPGISMPYMQKVGLDPSMFMPDVMTPQDASVQMGRAQMGWWNAPTNTLSNEGTVYNPFQQSVPQPVISQPIVQSTPVQTQPKQKTTTTTKFDPSSIYGSESFITKYGKLTEDNRVRVMVDPDASYEDKVRLAEEATALGFGKGSKAPIRQGRTEGYKYFYAGLTPADFEKRYLQGFMDVEDVEALTPVERRKKLFNELGIEVSEDKLTDPKSLYNDDSWVKNVFYEAFKKKLPADQFRNVMGNDLSFGLEHFDNIPLGKAKAKETKVPAAGPKPGTIEALPQRAQPGNYYSQDIINMGQTLSDRLGINKYMPYNVTLPQPVLMDPTFYDPSRELAANAEMANLVTQNLGQFAGPQALSSRASQIQGNAARSVADILGRYNNLNVGVANQFEQANKALINDFNIKRALAEADYYDKSTIANQQYDNTKRAANARFTQQATNAITNKATTQVLNSLFPEYAIDPTTGGQMMYVPSQRTYDGSASANTNPYSDVSSNIQALRKQFENDPDFQKLNSEQKLNILAKFIPKESSTTRRLDPRDVFLANLFSSRRGQ